MRIRFAEAANNELNDACEWFERQQSGLGERFRVDVREATFLIAKAPLLFPLELEDVRRYVMNRFFISCDMCCEVMRSGFWRFLTNIVARITV